MKKFSKVKRSISLLLAGVMLIAMSISGVVFAEGETDNLFDENMVYELTDTANFKSASAETTLTEDEKDAVFIDGGNATYTIPTVPETGWYMVSVSVKTVLNKKANYVITGSVGEVSWNQKLVSYPASRTVNIGSFYLEKGTSKDINFLFDSFTITSGSLPNVTLTVIKIARKNDIPVSASNATVIPALDYTNRVFRQGTTDDENPTWGSATTGDEINWGKGRAYINSKSNQYGLYNIDVEKTALYDVYVLKSRDANTMHLEVDGNLITKNYVGTSVPVTLPATAETVTAYTKIATVALVEGSHELNFKCANTGSGSTCFIGIKLVPVSAKEVSAIQGEKTTLSFGVDYLQGESLFTKVVDNTDDKIEGYDAEYYDGIENEFDPQSSKVTQMTDSDHYGTYAVDVKETGTYAISFVAGAYDRKFNIYVDDVLVRTSEYAQLNNKNKPNSSGSVHALVAKDHICNLFLTKGVHKIKIENASVSSGMYHVWFIEKTIAEPVVTLSDGDGEALESICDGTMNLTVDLNGCGEDLVYFAIYEEEDGVKKLNKICQATVTAGVAEGAITDFIQADGKTYSAKVFVWDEKTIFGHEYSF